MVTETLFRRAAGVCKDGCIYIYERVSEWVGEWVGVRRVVFIYMKEGGSE